MTNTLAERLFAYEEGVMDAEETLYLFADLIKTGLAWSLQGHYGRTAAALIEGGIISPDGDIADWALEEV